MKISKLNSINFQRRLKRSEEAEYSDILAKGKAKASHSEGGKSILIIPASSLPQAKSNNTGVGNLASEDAQKFFDFAKKYWGINEIQILPIGQYNSAGGEYRPYSCSSMNFGNHVINLKDFLSEKEFKKVVKNNKIHDRINYSNVIDSDSISEQMLKNVFERMTPEMKQEFEVYKQESSSIMETKSLYQALTEIYQDSDFKKWDNLDANLFDKNIIDNSARENRIKEIKKLKGESIEFYKFKNFLAEKSFQKAKKEINAKGLKLNGDVTCNFSYEEAWAHPNAFIKDSSMRWGFPILDINSPEAEALLRQKINFSAKKFDGFRVDASWTYVSPLGNKITDIKSKINNGPKFLDIIDDEVKKVKGADFDLNNIMHEFAADPIKDFNIYDDYTLKPYVENRVKIYTSDYLSYGWGSANNFLARGWDSDKFIIGAANHDSESIKISPEQIDVLSGIFNIPKEKLNQKSEFLKAKFAEPLRAKNNMIFFLPALGLDNKFSHLQDHTLSWTPKVPENYEDVYIKNLAEGTGYNPMDALEKQFIAQGLDKQEPELFKKIVKYRKILEKKEMPPVLKKCLIGAAVIGTALLGLGIIAYRKNKTSE